MDFFLVTLNIMGLVSLNCEERVSFSKKNKSKSTRQYSFFLTKPGNIQWNKTQTKSIELIIVLVLEIVNLI